jgi:hypothetical protein
MCSLKLIKERIIGWLIVTKAKFDSILTKSRHHTYGTHTFHYLLIPCQSYLSKCHIYAKRELLKLTLLKKPYTIKQPSRSRIILPQADAPLVLEWTPLIFILRTPTSIFPTNNISLRINIHMVRPNEKVVDLLIKLYQLRENSRVLIFPK